MQVALIKGGETKQVIKTNDHNMTNEVANMGRNKGDNGFRERPSHHWMMVSIQISVSGFQLFSIGINLSIFVNFMLALIVLSSITKKGEIVRKMAPLGHCFVILVIE